MNGSSEILLYQLDGQGILNELYVWQIPVSHVMIQSKICVILHFFVKLLSFAFVEICVLLLSS